MEKVKFILRLRIGENELTSGEILYVKSKAGITTRFLKDAYKFNSEIEAILIANKLKNEYIEFDILLKYGDDLWQKL